MSSPISAFLDYQTLSAVSRAALGAGGRKDRGREEIPASVAMGESVLKRELLMSYFHFLENTCAIVGGHGNPPGALRRGRRGVSGRSVREGHLLAD